eukprot:COSAG06_NODE_641_length_13489_cov_4.330769_8_plen_168_part_00
MLPSGFTSPHLVLEVLSLLIGLFVLNLAYFAFRYFDAEDATIEAGGNINLAAEEYKDDFYQFVAFITLYVGFSIYIVVAVSVQVSLLLVLLALLRWSCCFFLSFLFFLFCSVYVRVLEGMAPDSCWLYWYGQNLCRLLSLHAKASECVAVTAATRATAAIARTARAT